LAKDIALIPTERIERAILLVRGHKIILDKDLADLYGVETKYLVRTVKRNIARFPADFAFRFNAIEFDRLRCQIGTSNGRGGRRYLPFAFTEQGVAMLSSVLRSPRAVQVNIEIMRAFVRLRRILSGHKVLLRKIEAMEKKYDGQVRVVFDAIRELMAPSEPRPKKPVGYLTERDGCVP
jgi:hypothetical protein